MGLISATLGAAGGVLADTWREFFYCDSLGADILVSKGEKVIGGRSSNKKGSDNIISNGSIVAVNEGQFMMIVDQGKVVEFCDEPGQFVYDTSTEPSLFYGSFGKNLLETFKTFGKRISFGGDTGKDQRIYFFNKKEIIGNKYGTPNPVPFRVVDRNIGLDIDVSIRCHGEYSYRLVNPLLFYANVSGNVASTYNRSQIDSQLKTELMTALQPAFARISAMGIRYSALPGHTEEIAEALNEVLSNKWTNTRGLAVASFGVSAVTASEEDENMIKSLQRAAVFRDPTMAAAGLTSAQAEAMVGAANNPNAGPVMAFAGLNMAQGAGGMNAGNLYNMGKEQGAAAPAEEWKCSCGNTNTGGFCSFCGKQKPAPAPATADADTWKCPKCGTENKAAFCSECGTKKPDDNSWACTECGAKNKGKFCADCGAKKPADAKLYRCDKCGWEPKDPASPPKFCPECGDVFDEHDVQQ